jgi:hypothetical protein
MNRGGKGGCLWEGDGRECGKEEGVGPAGDQGRPSPHPPTTRRRTLRPQILTHWCRHWWCLALRPRNLTAARSYARAAPSAESKVPR